MYFSIPLFSIPDFSLPVFTIPGSGSDASSSINETVINFSFIILGDESAITPDLYKYVSDKYALVYRNIQDSYSDFENAVVHVARMDNVEAKLDLMKPLRLSKREFEQNRFVSQLYTATVRINTHVLDRSEQHDLNAWLNANSVKVLREWAILCSETGIIIEEDNIQN